MANSNSNSNQGRAESGFLHWISVQRTDLEELLHVLTVVPEADVQLLRALAQKTIQHLNDYQQTRSALSIYNPSWCTSFESSLFWVGGFKPSTYIRLLYSITEIGNQNLEPELSKLFNGERIRSRKIVECSDMQVKLIKSVHAETISSEENISSRMANLQECITIEPLVSDEPDVGRALAAHRVALNGIVVDADELRVKVLKELVHILTPLQGIHLLVALNRLHLSIHEWGTR